MEVQFELNGKPVCTEIEPGAVLFDILRSLGCYSVKCGCETTNCGLCTVWVDGTPRLSCSILAARAAGCKITTLEGVQEEAARFGAYLAAEGAEQCGYCSPGFIMNVGHGDTKPGRDPGVPGRKSLSVYGICRTTPGSGKVSERKKRIDV